MVRSRGSRGSVLLLVLVVVAVLALATQSYLDLMQNELCAVRFHGRRAQATRLAESGVEYLKTLLSSTDAEIESLGGIVDNPSALKAAVVDEPTEGTPAGQFTVFAPLESGAAQLGFRHGLENESAKLHVNSLLVGAEGDAARDRLLALPGMEPPVADAILDWLDDDDAQREFGAEEDYYRGLDPPYAPRNGPIASLDELLAVRGVTRELLYGKDVNGNYVVDESEAESNDLAALDADGLLDRGWAAYLTVFSSELRTSPDDAWLIDVNGSDLQAMHTDLTSALSAGAANFIVLYRQYGGQSQQNSGGSGSTGAGGQRSARQSGGGNAGRGRGGRSSGSSRSGNNATSATAVTIDFTKPANNQIASLLDLVGATVQIPADEEKKTEEQTIASPWQDRASRELLELYDAAGVGSAKRIAGRVNVNLASRPVLLSLPGMTAQIADQVISRRQTSDDQRHAVWLYADGAVELDTMKQLEPYVTAGGNVYRAQVAGFYASGGSVARLEVCLDATGTRPRLVEIRDLTNLGTGFLPVDLGMMEELE